MEVTLKAPKAFPNDVQAGYVQFRSLGISGWEF